MIDIVGNNGGTKTLGSILDVLLDSITDDEILQYDLASNLWENKTLTEAGALLNTSDIFIGVLSVVGSIDNAPGSDTDTDLITVGVTGTPTFSWDESEDSFNFNKNLLISIASSGGTFTSDRHLVIESTGQTGIQFSSTSTQGIEFGDADSPTAGRILYQHSGDAMRLFTAEIEAMRIDSVSDLLIGLTAGNDGKVHIDQSSATGAKPVLTLDQADLSEEFFSFVGVVAVGNPIEAVGAKSLTTTHFLRVEVDGLERYIEAGTIA